MNRFSAYILVFGATHSVTQILFPILYSVITLGNAGPPFGVLRMEPRSAICKASDLIPVLFTSHLSFDFN